MIKRGVISHIEIYVSNLERTIEFWDWLLTELNYKKYKVWKEGISYKFSDSYIVFAQTESNYLDVAYHRKRTGLNHLAFYVESPQIVDYFTSKLKERNVNILYNDRHPFAAGKDSYAVFFEDPDRIKVELVSSSKGSIL